jgi:peptide/nickel transport system substrate-binding protein
MARAIGIDLSPYVYMEDATLVARVFTQGDYDCIMWNWGMPPNPTFMLSVESCSSFHTLSDVYYCNPAYERLFQAQSGEADPTVRRQLVYEAQKIFYYDAAYSVLYYPDVLQPHRTNHLTGWLNPAGGTVNNFVTRNYTSLRGV